MEKRGTPECQHILSLQIMRTPPSREFGRSLPAAVVQSVRKLPGNGLSRILKKDQIEVVAVVPDLPASESRDAMRELQQEIRGLKRQFAELRTAQHSHEGQSQNHLARLFSELGTLPCFHDELAEILPARAND